jgi:hypothetical protein
MQERYRHDRRQAVEITIFMRGYNLHP